MSVPNLYVNGHLITSEESAVVILDETANPIYLRFGLADLATGGHLFPELLLDDWGKETRGLKIYNWIEENGLHFPRAEIFGFDAKGLDVQFFVREIDIAAPYLCYAFERLEAPLIVGRRVKAILQELIGVTSINKSKRPLEIKRPLSNGALSWWSIPVNLTMQERNRLVTDLLNELE